MHSTSIGSEYERAPCPGRVLKGLFRGLVALGLFLGAVGPARSQFLYWSDTYYIPEHGGDIQRAKVDGSGQQILVRGLNAPTGAALDLAGGKMYWADLVDGQIWRANLDGTGPEIVVGQQPMPAHLALDNVGHRMYWPTNPFGTGDIRRASLDGSGEEILITDLPGPSQVALDTAGGRMYWVEYSGGDIRRANLDGSGQEILVQNLSNPSELALDLRAEKMYWTNKGTGEIQRASLDGSEQETLLRVPDAFGLAVDFASGKIYWSEYDIGSIGRANLDGTEQETLITGLPGPIGLALDLRTFLITAAPSAVSGTSFDVTITALDPYGNIDANYQGAVFFSTTDPEAGVVLPAVYTFTTGIGGDNGVHTFPGVTLITIGDQTITAADPASGITGSATVTVGPGP